MAAIPGQNAPPEAGTRSLDALVEATVVRAGVAPCGVAGLSVACEGGWRRAVGAAGRTPAGAASIFDLASITKCFTALATARLVSRGELSWDASLGDLWGGEAPPSARGLRLDALLGHRAGLFAHRELFRELAAGRPMRRSTAMTIAARQRPNPAGALYSDFGPLLVGWGLERRASAALDEVLRREIAAPLGLRVDSVRGHLARGIRSSALVETEVVAWRGGLVRGAVHDDNAWALGGHGTCGHAGLFGSVADLLGLGEALLDCLGGDARWLRPATLRRMLEPVPGTTLRVGFDGRSPGESVAGQRSSPLTFGHLGFTGTSLWCDPTRRAVTVLLTNRVCPTRTRQGIRAARAQVHDALWALGERSARHGADTPTSK